MEINFTKNKSDEIEITITGDISSSESDELLSEITDNMFYTSLITLDLSQVNAVSNNFIRILLEAEKIGRSSCRLRLNGVNNELLNTFRMFNLTKIIEINESWEINKKASIPNEENVFLIRYILSKEELEIVPLYAKALLSQDLAYTLALYNVNQTLEGFTVVLENKNEKTASLIFLHVSSETYDLWRQRMLFKLINEDLSRRHIKLNKIYLSEEDHKNEGYLKLIDIYGFTESDSHYSSLEYSKDTISNSKLLKGMINIESLKNQILTLNELDEGDLLAINSVLDYDYALIDPLLCRFFRCNDSIAASICAFELINYGVVITDIKVKPVSGTERAFIMMLGIIAEIFSLRFSDGDKLCINRRMDQENSKIASLLGLPDKEYKYYILKKK